MRDIEGRANLVETPDLAILRQFGLDLHPRHVEKIANGVLVLVGVQAAQSSAASLADDTVLIGAQRGTQFFDELVHRFDRKPRHSGWRHFARGNAVMNFDPSGEVIEICRFVVELREV